MRCSVFCCCKVCGGHGNAHANSSCPESPCGGAGCRDSEGVLKCGGRGCNGTVGASVTALDRADDVRTNLTAASEELQAMIIKVCTVCFCLGKSASNLNFIFMSASRRRYTHPEREDASKGHS